MPSKVLTVENVVSALVPQGIPFEVKPEGDAHRLILGTQGHTHELILRLIPGISPTHAAVAAVEVTGDTVRGGPSTIVNVRGRGLDVVGCPSHPIRLVAPASGQMTLDAVTLGGSSGFAADVTGVKQTGRLTWSEGSVAYQGKDEFGGDGRGEAKI